MKKLFTILALLACAASLRAQYVTKLVTFDQYTLPDTNDYTIWFSGGVGYTYQVPVGSLGGYVIPPDTNAFGSGNPTYCFKYHVNGSFDSCVTSIDFLYDSTAVSPTGFQRAATLWLTPSADWNHYIEAGVTRNKHLEINSYAWANNGGPLLPLHHNHWYRLELHAQFISGFAGWLYTTTANVFDLGNGSQLPVLIGTDTGGGNDGVLPTDPAISVSFSGAQDGGAVKLDNFKFYGIPSSDSCSAGLPCTAPTVNAVANNPSCSGETGSIDLTVSGGAGSYTFAWSNGMTTEDLSGVPAGDYSVTVTDAGSCAATANAFVVSPAAVAAALSSTPDNASAGCSGTASAAASGGTPTYTYLWSNGATNATANNLCEGWYIVTVTDLNGCAIADSVFVDFTSSVERIIDNGLRLYPNPVSDVVRVSGLTVGAAVKIYSLDGKLLKQVGRVANQPLEIEVADLAPALYLIAIETNAGILFRKLSVQR